MEKLSQILNQIDNQDFAGLSDFVWWYGVVEDRKDPLYLGRLKVRCIGFHTDNKDEIPTDELPWAQVISPITSSGISGIGTTPVGLIEGSHVFGFFRDGKEGQEPVVLGSCVGIPSVMANRRKGFFDPRSFEDKTMYPYPPFYIDRTRDGKPGHIVDFHENVDKVYYFRGENTYAKTGSKLYYEYDSVSDKAIAIVKQTNDDFVRASLQTYSSNPNENFMEFDDEGKMLYSFPSIPLLSFTKQRLKLKTDRYYKDNPVESDSEEYQTTLNPFSEIYKSLYGVNNMIDEYRRNLHTGILTADPKVTISVPVNCYDPEYPFNHVTYTESGHAFEMDDTPNKERIRILHRSTSFIDFQNDGSRIDNVIGRYYLTTDSNFESFIMGNEIKNVGGNQNILINSRGATTNSIFRIKGKGNYEIKSDSGNIMITAGENIILKAKKILHTRQDGNEDLLTQTFEKFNLEVKNSPIINFDNVQQFALKTLGSMGVNAGQLDQNVLGVFNNTIDDKYIKTVLGKASETYNNLLGSNAKVESASTGNLMHYVVNPLRDIILKHSFDEDDEGILTPTYTGLKIGGQGVRVESRLGNAEFNLNGPTSSFSVSSGSSIDLNSLGGKINLQNLLANISIGNDGRISIKNQTSSLKGIVDKLLDAINSLTVTTPSGPSGPPINSSAFTAIKQELSTFLN